MQKAELTPTEKDNLKRLLTELKARNIKLPPQMVVNKDPQATLLRYLRASKGSPRHAADRIQGL